MNAWTFWGYKLAAVIMSTLVVATTNKGAQAGGRIYLYQPVEFQPLQRQHKASTVCDIVAVDCARLRREFWSMMGV